MFRVAGSDGLDLLQLVEKRRQAAHGGHGFILGVPGSGKTMAAQQQIRAILENSEDTVVVLDVDGGYRSLAEVMDGQIIALNYDSDVHINPFDMNTSYWGTEFSLSLKVDFVEAWLEVMLGSGMEFSAEQRSIVDRCIREAYAPYLTNRHVVTGEYDSGLLPTLRDFYRILRGYEGHCEEHYRESVKALVLGIEAYILGVHNMFSLPTNVHCDKRFVVFDLSGLGQSIWTSAMMAVLEYVWTHFVIGQYGAHRCAQKVWIFMDEIYYLLQRKGSSYFLSEVIKMGRALGCTVTGVTMDAASLCEGDPGRSILCNCEFLHLLRLPAYDRQKIAELLGLSELDLAFIGEWAPAGQGLVCVE